MITLPTYGTHLECEVGYIDVAFKRNDGVFNGQTELLFLPLGHYAGYPIRISREISRPVELRERKNSIALLITVITAFLVQVHSTARLTV